MNVRDKIAKLLALAESPNENEAKAALLKARELMAQHKLRPEDCAKAENTRVRREPVDVKVSKTKYKWAIQLASVIAEHYCCRSYRNHQKGARLYNIGFVGLEDDFEICKRIFLYAFDCVKTRADQMVKEVYYFDAAFRRSLAESYGMGFVKGLSDAFRQQDQEKQQEWGLVMVVPKAVDDAMTDMKTVKKPFAVLTIGSEQENAALAMGYNDGQKFDPGTRLENDTSDKAPVLKGAM